jgi:hypothetical protein
LLADVARRRHAHGVAARSGGNTAAAAAEEEEEEDVVKEETGFHLPALAWCASRVAFVTPATVKKRTLLHNQ